MTEQVTTNLEVLENRAEKALEKAEAGWREFAEAMREIKESEAHKQAGYQYFGPYYTERWEPETGKSLRVVSGHIRGITTWESVERIDDHRQSLTPPASYDVAARLNKIPEAETRAEFWRDRVLVDKPDGRIDGNELARRVNEYVGEGVIERAEAAGVPVPQEPKGKTPSEAAWLAMAEASRLVRGVEPADAARVENGRIAARYQEQMWELAEWTRLFAHELASYVEEVAARR